MDDPETLSNIIQFSAQNIGTKSNFKTGEEYGKVKSWGGGGGNKKKSTEKVILNNFSTFN